MLATSSLTVSEHSPGVGVLMLRPQLGQLMVLADSVGTHEREAAPRENVKTEVTTTLGPIRRTAPQERPRRGG